MKARTAVGVLALLAACGTDPHPASTPPVDAGAPDVTSPPPHDGGPTDANADGATDGAADAGHDANLGGCDAATEEDCRTRGGYCSYGTARTCSGDGHCIERPSTCPQLTDCAAVCGCNGVYHCSECEAQQAGYDRTSGTPPCSAPTTFPCGSTTCSFPSQFCRLEGAVETCVAMPAECVPNPGCICIKKGGKTGCSGPTSTCDDSAGGPVVTCDP